MEAGSLRRQLLAWLLLPLAGVVGLNLWTTHETALATADLVTDQLLLASARMIAEQIKAGDGIVEAPIPPAALELFASAAHDRVVYRVTSPAGMLVAGYPDLPAPRHAPDDLLPEFFATRFRGEAVRAVALDQPVVGLAGHAMVVVAQTNAGHDAMVATLWAKAARDGAVLVMAAGLLALAGLRRGLAPLLRLRREVLARDPAAPEAAEALDATAVQTELQPLVAALNHATARIRAHLAAQRRFIANAAHQLRTPLAVLRTQAALARRTADPEALGALEASLERMTRVTNQLVTLALAEHSGVAPRHGAVDLHAILRDTLAALTPLALERGIDLGLEAAEAPAPMRGDATLLSEAIANLVENALRHTPRGGRVTAALSPEPGAWRCTVEDTGPGIPEAEHEAVFERFHRAAGATGTGSGLGLAIVREIVRAHGGGVALENRHPGLAVTLRLPAG